MAIELKPGESLWAVGVRPAGCASIAGYEWDEYDVAARTEREAIERARAMANDADSELVDWYGWQCEIADRAYEPAAVHFG